MTGFIFCLFRSFSTFALTADHLVGDYLTLRLGQTVAKQKIFVYFGVLSDYS